MDQQANEQVAEAPIGWSAEQVRKIGKTLWARILENLTARRERRAAAALYAALSKLSDAELERRGIARGDLHRQVFETLPHP